MENKTPSPSDLTRKKIKVLVDTLSASALLILYILMIAAFMLVIAQQTPPQAGDVTEVPLAKAAIRKEPPKPACVHAGPICEEEPNE